MKYEYTWNHLLLLARVCGRIDNNEDSVTSAWVQITEEHNRQTFPFTLWPLTYRTCEVTTSPAMCTPVRIGTMDYVVTMFKSNEVVIICIQENLEDGPCDGKVCHHPCLAQFDEEADEAASSRAPSNAENHEAIRSRAPSNAENHVDTHSTSASDPLLPCHEAHRYRKMKTIVDDAFYDIQDNVECVICTGHGQAAAIASCLAFDMSQTYDAEKEFLGLETPRVEVDFVGFSDSVVASPAYWSKISSSITMYILVSLESRAAKKSDTTMIVNPHSLRVTIGTSPEKTPSIHRSMSLFHRHKVKAKKAKKVDTHKESVRPISEYISALNDRVNLPKVSIC